MLQFKNNALQWHQIHWRIELTKWLQFFHHFRMLHQTFLASSFSLQGVNSFTDGLDCRDRETECLDGQGNTRQRLRDEILSTDVTIDSTTYQFNRALRYVEAAYDIHLINVVNGQAQEVSSLLVLVIVTVCVFVCVCVCVCVCVFNISLN